MELSSLSEMREEFQKLQKEEDLIDVEIVQMLKEKRNNNFK
jgi:hypothetical protein